MGRPLEHALQTKTRKFLLLAPVLAGELVLAIGAQAGDVVLIYIKCTTRLVKVKQQFQVLAGHEAVEAVLLLEP